VVGCPQGDGYCDELLQIPSVWHLQLGRWNDAMLVVVLLLMMLMMIMTVMMVARVLVAQQRDHPYQ